MTVTHKRNRPEPQNPCAIPPHRRRAPAKAHCDASATVDHPEGETAHYRGEAEWEADDMPAHGHDEGHGDSDVLTDRAGPFCGHEPATYAGS